jgi:hypothetical protein
MHSSCHFLVDLSLIVVASHSQATGQSAFLKLQTFNVVLEAMSFFCHDQVFEVILKSEACILGYYKERCILLVIF